MKFQNAFLIGIMSTMCLTSCLSEAFEGDDASKDKGTLQVSVDLQEPASRATSEVYDFPVSIYDANGKELYSYQTVTAVPKSITLQVGNYVVASHTPGAIQKKMATPYYKGEKDVEILKNVSSRVDVICKMENSKINVSYTDNFRTTFKAWDITISDGSETALSFLNSDVTNSVYWYFGENGVKELTVNFRGTTNAGNTVAGKFILTKDNADASYDDDRENFGGGDIINLTFDPTDATDGTVSSVTINADVTFTETNETITVDVVDVPTFEEPDPNPGPNDDPKIILNLPAPLTLTFDTDKSLGDTYIKAEEGLKSIGVKIVSTSEDMINSVADLAAIYDVDFIAGAEIVGNQKVVNLFQTLGQPLSVPAEGDIEYTFPIGNFFSLLTVLPGEHTFVLTVTDMTGAKKSGNVKITVL